MDDSKAVDSRALAYVNNHKANCKNTRIGGGWYDAPYRLKLTVSLGAFNQPTPPYFKEDVMSEHQAIAVMVVFVGFVTASISLANAADRKGDGWGLFGSLVVAVVALIATVVVYSRVW